MFIEIINEVNDLRTIMILNIRCQVFQLSLLPFGCQGYGILVLGLLLKFGCMEI